MDPGAFGFGSVLVMFGPPICICFSDLQDPVPATQFLGTDSFASNYRGSLESAYV